MAYKNGTFITINTVKPGKCHTQKPFNTRAHRTRCMLNLIYPIKLDLMSVQSLMRYSLVTTRAHVMVTSRRHQKLVLVIN